MKNSKVHYSHGLNYTVKDKLVGIFVSIAIIAMMGLFVVKVKTSKLFADVIYYQTYMKNAQGISTETIVNISGIDVGRVSSLNIAKNNEIHITFFIYRDFQNLLRIDSTGKLNKLSLVGNAMILIKAGSAHLPLLKENSVIVVEEPVTTDDLIEGLTPIITDLKSLIGDLSLLIKAIDPQIVKETASNINLLIRNAGNLSEHVTQGKGTLGKILYDKKQQQSVNNSLLLIEKTLNGISNRVIETKPLLNNVNKLSLESTKMVGDLRHSLQIIDQQLETLPALMDSTDKVLNSSEKTLQGIQKVWPLSSTIQQPSPNLTLDEELDD